MSGITRASSSASPGLSSRRRDCRSAAPPFLFSRRFNMDGEGGVSKMTVEWPALGWSSGR